MPAPPAKPSSRLVSPAVRRAWWGPLAVVVTSLVLLAVAPFITSARVRALRDVLTEQVDPARVLVNDIEASLATQMYALGEFAQRDSLGRADADARYRAARAEQAADEAALAPLVRRLGPAAAERFVEMRTLAAEWHHTTALPTSRPHPAPRPRAPDAARNALALARAAMDAAGRLERLLAELGAAQRARIRTVERWDQLLPLLLVPLAALSVGIVVRAGERTARLAAAAEEGRRTLAAAAAAREALLRGVSHDVKNPLGAALGYAQLLEDGVLGPVTDAQRDVAVRLRRLMQLALGTVTDLLDLSRAGDGALPVTPAPADLATVVRELVADYDAAARAAGLQVVLGGADAACPITTDAARVRQVLGNLMSNALKYTPPGGGVQVTLAAQDGRARVTVRDSGPGIPPALGERVFDEFFRVPGSEQVAAGTGVGLAIARHVARRLGGDLTLATAGPPGACFVLTLPLDDRRAPRAG